MIQMFGSWMLIGISFIGAVIVGVLVYGTVKWLLMKIVGAFGWKTKPRQKII